MQIISNDPATHRTRLRVQAPAVPALGYAVIHVAPTSSTQSVTSTLKASSIVLENEFVRVEVNPVSGCVTSLVNKADGKANAIAAGGCGNLLQTFLWINPLRQDAWEIRFDPGRTGT